MKVIGLIGNMSWNFSLECYQLVNEFVDWKPDGFHSARLILCDLGFDETGPSDMPRVLPGREQK
jgi:aspartate racemase